jgi:hypothetical protein
VSNLLKKIPAYKEIENFAFKHPRLVDRGRIAEYFVSSLLGVKLSSKINAPIDGTSKKYGRVEIKNRLISTKTPPGMKVNLKAIDHLIYVELGSSAPLLRKIWVIPSKALTKQPAGRVSLKKAFKNSEYTRVF